MRFSYFSHIQDLATHQLVLTSPFRSDSQQPTRCCYELHAVGPELFEPDPTREGVAAYHRLLPFSQSESDALPLFPIFRERHTFDVHIAGETLAIEQVVPHTGLPFWVSLGQAKLMGETQLWAPVLGYEDVDYLRQDLSPELTLYAHPNGKTQLEPHPQLTFNAPSTAPAQATSLAPWHHPFRLEGMKLAAFELYQNAQQPPTILLNDLSGEWAFAFIEAARMIRQCTSEDLPFRLILLEDKPFDRLARAFEGRSFANPTSDKAVPASFYPLPQAVIDPIVAGVTELGGTVIASDAQAPRLGNTSLPFAAMETLIRTGFIDEDDDVVYLQPYRSPMSLTIAGGYS